MSSKKPKLTDRALAALTPSTSDAAPVHIAAATPRTGPGVMITHLERESAARVENERLREELKAWEDAKATKLLDPKVVGWSRYANRDQENFSGAEFEQLMKEIESAGGNVQPIKVRRATPGGEHQFEIVFGHRRHRACLQLGLPVLAVIDNLSDVELFVQMDRENRSRKNLSAWEQGMMYLRAIESGLFSSNKRLADGVGVDLAQVGKAISLAKLPREVIEAFASPLDLQFRWAKPLDDASKQDLPGLIASAVKAKDLGPDRSARAVLDLLLGAKGEGGGTVLPPPIVIKLGEKDAALVEMDSKGRASVTFAPAVIGSKQLKELGDVVQAFLAKSMKSSK